MPRIRSFPDQGSSRGGGQARFRACVEVRVGERIGVSFAPDSDLPHVFEWASSTGDSLAANFYG
jgi:hypothetical protein